MYDSFYTKMVNDIYHARMRVGDTEFGRLSIIAFIEQMHKQADIKGPAFYKNLGSCMMAHNFAKLPAFGALRDEVYDYCRHKIQDLDLTSSVKPGSNESKVEPNSFYDLFYDQNDIDLCFDVLKNDHPAVINKNKEFALGPRKKQVITAWYNVLFTNGYIRYVLPEKVVLLLNDVIVGLSIDARTIRRDDAKYYREYYDRFTKHLSPRLKK